MILLRIISSLPHNSGKGTMLASRCHWFCQRREIKFVRSFCKILINKKLSLNKSLAICIYFLFVLLFLGQSETNLMLRDRKTETSELKLLSNFKLKTNISALKSIIQFSRSSQEKRLGLIHYCQEKRDKVGIRVIKASTSDANCAHWTI